MKQKTKEWMLLTALIGGVAGAAPTGFGAESQALWLDGAPGTLERSVPTTRYTGTLATVVQEDLEVSFVDCDPTILTNGRLGGAATVFSINGSHQYKLVVEHFEQLGRQARVERGYSIDGVTGIKRFYLHSGADDMVLTTPTNVTKGVRVLEVSDSTGDSLASGQRTGGPAMLVQEADTQYRLVVPCVSSHPYFITLQMDQSLDMPETTWLETGRRLEVRWMDQLDVLTLDPSASGGTHILLERKFGLHADEIVSLGVPYVPPAPITGQLLAHYSFDDVSGSQVFDSSGNGYTATISGGVRLMPGINGSSIDGVSCSNVPDGQLVIPTYPEGTLPGELLSGQMLLPAEILTNVSTQLSISFWYLMPPALEAYNYLGYNTARDVSIGYDDRVFEMPGFKVYSLESWGYGHMMTADGLGTTRLFGMYGPAQPIDRWNHFVFTIDGKEARIYINGKQAYDPSFGTKTLAELKVPGQPLCVMSNVWACMDELRLYNYVLPQSEIDGLYRSDGQGELARYSFDNEAIGAVSAVHDDAGYEASAVGAQVVGESNGASFLLGPGGGLTMPAALTFGKDCSAFTYATWVKRPVGQSDRFTLMKAAADARYSMEVGFWNNALWGSAAQSPIVGSFPNDGGWHHLIVSYGNSRLRAYVDGVKVQDNPQAYMDPYYGFGVGTLTLTNATTVGIGVDDMRFFNFALSDEQALQVYLGTDAELIPEPPAGLDQPRRVLSSGFLAEFFDFGDTNLTTVPDLTLRAADETRTVGQISYPGSSGAFLDLDSRFVDYFADRHSGSLSIPVAGDYTFAVESDDGFRLLIDGQLVALSDVSGRQQTAPLSLSAGLHPFVLLHYENTGVAGLRLLWSGPGIDGEELIPASALYKADYIDALTPMQRWRLRSWGVIDAGGLFAPDADYNGDGVKNLMAYAMGASPMGPVPLPEGSFENGRMRMAFNRVRDHTDIIYEVAASDNMIDWATIWSSETVPYGNPAAESERVIVEDVSPPHEANRRFMELRVIRLWQ